MAKLWLVAVLLLLSASVGSSMNNLVNRPNNQAQFTRPSETQIARIVNDLWNRYRPSYQSRFNNYPRKNPMFSLAVTIPYDNKMQRYDVSGVTDNGQTVRRTIEGCDVYRSKTMVAATVLRWDNVLDQCPDALVPWEDVLNQCRRTRMTWAEVNNKCPEAVRVGRADHAEYRVLNNFNALTENLNKNDFLLFYVLASPCDQRCLSTNSRFNILDSIRVIEQWTNYAVVFSDVFAPREGDQVPPDNLKGALERLGEKVGLQNILRCDGSVPCTSCSSGNNVITPFCYDINAPKPAARDNAPSTSVIVPPGGNANAPSKTGQKNNNNNNNNNENPGGSTNVDEEGWQDAGKRRG